MDKQRRKELQEQFKQIKVWMGVYKITNAANGKIFIEATPNLKNKWQTIQDFQFAMNRFQNTQLQQDWNRFGAEAFSFEVLEEREVEEGVDTAWELKKMKKKWLEKLQPYAEKGYNKLPKPGWE